MADLKISQLNAGNPAQAADLIPIARNVSGTETNFSVTAASLASLYGGVGTIDASTQAGSDICAQINNAWVTLRAITPLGGTVTVFNNPGVISCSSNPFASYPGGFNGRLLIAPYTQIQTSASWVIPFWVYIDGMSTHPVTNSGITGSAIQASNTFPTNTPLIQVGSGAVIGGVVVTNIRLSCNPPSGVAISGCIAYQNQWSQENTRLENVVLNGEAFGMDISTSQSQNMGTVRNVTIGMPGVNNANAQCFRIGSSAGTLSSTTFFSNISMGGSANAVQPTVLGTIDATAVTIAGLHMEAGVTCLLIGSQLSTHAVTIMGADCNGTVSPAYPVTNCIEISNAHTNNYITLMGSWAPTFGSVTNMLVDQQTNGGTIPSATEPVIGLYARGANNTIVTTSNVITSSLPTVTLNQYTVATLPSAATLGAGAQVIVTDNLTFGVGGCVGGGSDYMIAVSNGTTWSCH